MFSWLYFFPFACSTDFCNPNSILCRTLASSELEQYFFLSTAQVLCNHNSLVLVSTLVFLFEFLWLFIWSAPCFQFSSTPRWKAAAEISNCAVEQNQALQQLEMLNSLYRARYIWSTLSSLKFLSFIYISLTYFHRDIK